VAHDAPASCRDRCRNSASRRCRLRRVQCGCRCSLPDCPTVSLPMTWLRRTEFGRSLPRRFCAILVLVCYLASAIGFPLPAPAGKDVDQPFPCQNHPCGCRTAEECWRHCCCLTPEQRWAWARGHHVQPPPYAEKPTSRGWRSVRQRDRAGPRSEHQAACSCCTPKGNQKRRAVPSRKTCCGAVNRSSAPHPATASTRPKRSPAPGEGGRWALGLAAQQCKGLNTLWITAGAVLLPPPPPSWSPSLALVGRLSYPDVSVHAVSATPPEPPPRQACA
jgi:hypothetical protein